MKKIKTFMLAIAAMAAAVSFVACSSDDDTSNNSTDFQAQVDNMVNAEKKSDNAILLVAFGSTWQQSFDTFDALKAEYQAKYPEWDVYLAFSSAICSNQANAWEHKDDGAEQRDYFAPEYWLTAIGKCAYKQIVVQSLQVIPGEEYARVCDVYVKDLLNNKYRLFTEEYMHSLDGKVQVGTSLMDDEDDVKEVANALYNEADVQTVIKAGGTVAFMGHGNPVKRYAEGNMRYWMLEEQLQAVDQQKTGINGLKRFFVGTVDDEGTTALGENLCEQVVERMEAAGVDKAKLVQLYPLMSISGDHAHNDLSDPEDEESWLNVFKAAGYSLTQAEETNFTEPCWKQYKKGEGYIPALAERKAIRAIWMKHTDAAIADVKAGKGISTPTTSTEE